MKISKLFWEFDHDDKNQKIESHDSEHLDKVWEQTKSLVIRLSLIGAKSLIVYSGNRGYHVWAYIKSTPIKFESSEQERFARVVYKNMIFNVFDDVEKYPNFDRIPTHINSLARVPFSYHQKTKLQVVPLTLDREPYIPNIQEFIDSPISRDYRLKCMNEGLTQANRNYKKVEITDWKIRPVIKMLMAANPDHNVRLAFLLDAIYAGMTDDEIQGEFKRYCPHDYNQFKTQYQIEYQREAVKSGVRPVSYDTLIRWGVVKEREGWAK
jgi:hypothetical protein